MESLRPFAEGESYATAAAVPTERKSSAQAIDEDSINVVVMISVTDLAATLRRPCVRLPNAVPASFIDVISESLAPAVLAPVAVYAAGTRARSSPARAGTRGNRHGGPP